MPILLALLLLLLPVSTPAGEVLTFGIVPQQSASKLARLWGPILAHLSRDAGIELRFATAPDIPTFEKRLAAGEYDIAYMNPYHYTVFSEAPGYQALAKARDKKIRGILVVRKDSPIMTPEQLDGATLAFPAPAAFAASLLTRAHLKAVGVTFEPAYVASHDSVYRAVAKGLYPAGGGVMRTLNNLAPEIRSQLRVLWTTEAFTPHAIAVHPRVPLAERQEIGAALFRIADSPEGRTLVEALNLKGFEAAANQDWNDVRALDIRELDDL
jgi:phosphonate transport system substrate-binding protein